MNFLKYQIDIVDINTMPTMMLTLSSALVPRASCRRRVSMSAFWVAALVLSQSVLAFGQTTSARGNFEPLPTEASRKKERRVRAIEALNEAQKLAGNEMVPEQERFNTALTHCDKAIAIERTYWCPYLWRGSLLMQLGRDREAIQALTKVLVLPPEHPDEDYREDETRARSILRDLGYPHLETPDGNLSMELVCVKNGNQMALQQLASVSDLAKALGLVASTENNAVTFTLDDHAATLSAGSNSMVTSNGPVALQSLPRMINGELHVSPIEVAKAFDTVVTWDGAAGAFSFSSSKREWGLKPLPKLAPLVRDNPTLALVPRALNRPITNPARAITCLAQAPDGRFIIAASPSNSPRLSRGSIEIWGTATGKLLQVVLDRYGRVTALAFSPNRNLLLAGGDNGVVHAYNFESGTGRDIASLGQAILKLSFSPDGSQIFCGTATGDVMLFDATTLRPNPLALGDSLSSITRLRLRESNQAVLEYSLDWARQQVAVSEADKEIRLWMLPDGRKKLSVKSNSDIVTGVSISPDGSRVVLRTSYGLVTRGCTAVAVPAVRLSIKDSTLSPYYIDNPKFAGDNGTIAGLCRGRLVLWAPKHENGEPLHQVEGSYLSCFDIAPESPQLVAADTDGRIFVWE